MCQRIRRRIVHIGPGSLRDMNQARSPTPYDAVRRRPPRLDRESPRRSRVKPKLRGWLHLGTAPLTLAAGIVLICLSPTPTTRIGSAVFAASALLLFTVSAIYHTGTWSPRVWAFLRRFDHANIFMLIAGSYTPFSLLLLEGTAAAWCCSRPSGAARSSGVLFRVFWTDAPRWLYVPIYIALGWAAIFFVPGFFDGRHRARPRHRRSRSSC